jgi:phosphatidylserine decarboxylase
VDVVLKFIVVALVVIAGTLVCIGSDVIRYSVFSVVAIAAAFVLNFFRDPERVTPGEKNIVFSPADGKVVLIKELFEPEYLRANAVQVSIFMSPLNVHVNRFPISGTV